ncbi:MAG: aspartate aminotransferase family protein [Chitinophagales bacterium]|jgi:acetylornithine/succinyldiaminopimelate/putrescine aminotransferase|nr:aspartate aminotransferase family protein [Chitinophagales bacterium]
MLTSRQIFLQHIAQTSDLPLALEFDRALGSWMYGPKGRMLDMISGISVSNVGHSHPKIIQAVQEQITKFAHLMVYGEFVQSPQALLAKAIVDSIDLNLDNVYFLNSGTEVVELAIKLAKRYTGRQELISFRNAYHGSTHGSLSVMGDEFFKTQYRPLLSHCHSIRYNIFEDLAQITEKTAGVIVEVVQAEAGIIPGNEQWLKTLEERCREVGALLIVDEIQTGMGRLGGFSGSKLAGIHPDILLLAKGFGGGMPISALLAKKSTMSVLMNNPYLGHLTTFGGNAVCAAAALANLNVIQEEIDFDRVITLGNFLSQELTTIFEVSVRHRGLMIGVDFENVAITQKIIKKAIDFEILTDWFLFNPSTMRIGPSLNISDEDIDFFLTQMKKIKSNL